MIDIDIQHTVGVTDSGRVYERKNRTNKDKTSIETVEYVLLSNTCNVSAGPMQRNSVLSVSKIAQAKCSAFNIRFVSNIKIF